MTDERLYLRDRMNLSARIWGDLRSASLPLPLLLLCGLAAVNIALQPSFVQPAILHSNLTTFLPLIVIAMAQAYVVLGGSIDLSLGAIVSLVNVLVVQLVGALGGGVDAILIGLAAGLGVGTLCGLANGFLIGFLNLPAIIVTFATSVVIGGLSLLVMPQAGGALPVEYFMTYAGTFGGLPVVLWLLIAFGVAAALMARTKFVAHLMAMGGQPQSAYQTGLGTAVLRLKAHAVAGLLSGAAALCVLGVSGSGDPLMGHELTLGSISAVVLGGLALAGGWGSVIGAMIGGLIIALVNNIIFFSGLNYIYQGAVQGLIILSALAFGVVMSRRMMQ